MQKQISLFPPFNPTVSYLYRFVYFVKHFIFTRVHENCLGPLGRVIIFKCQHALSKQHYTSKTSTWIIITFCKSWENRYYFPLLFWIALWHIPSVKWVCYYWCLICDLYTSLSCCYMDLIKFTLDLINI